MIDTQWFEASNKDELLQLAGSAIAEAKQDNSWRVTDYYTYLRLYDSKLVNGLARSQEGLGHSDRIALKYFATEPGSVQNGTTINIVRRITDYALNKVGKSRPDVALVTDGATWDTHIRAKELRRLVKGAWYQGKLDEQADVALLHACLLGSGVVKVLDVTDRVEYEWVFPGELYIPEREQAYGAPQQLWQVKSMDKRQAVKRFPALKKHANHLATTVDVWEGWRLPTGPKEGDGRHVVLVPSVQVLVDEEWAHPRFPFAFIHYAKPPVGFWSSGLGRLLMRYQVSINIVLRNIEQNVRLGGALKVYVKRGSAVNNTSLGNDLRGAIVEYTDTPPAWSVNPSVSPDIKAHLDYLVSQAWEETGWNQTNSTAEKPPGFNSGIAFRTWLDSITERQVMLSKSWEALYRELAVLTIDAAERIYERTDKFVATYVGDSELQRVTMTEAMLDREDFEVRVLSAARLPDTPAGRFQYVEELAANGYIDRVTAMKLIDVPDVESELSRQLAARDLIDERINRILKGDVALAPHDRMDLNLAKQRASMAYQDAELKGAPVEVLETLANWIDQVDEMLKAMTPPAPPPEAPTEQPIEGEPSPDAMPAVA